MQIHPVVIIVGVVECNAEFSIRFNALRNAV